MLKIILVSGHRKEGEGYPDYQVDADELRYE